MRMLMNVDANVRMRVLMNVDTNAGGCRCRCGWWIDADAGAGGRWMRVDVYLAMCV